MEEFGVLEGKERNRYWEIKLSKYRFLIGGSSFWFKLCWNLLTLAMAMPLLAAAMYYSLRFRKKRGTGETGIPYGHFTGIYPGCVYSPFTKGYELNLYRECEMKGPVLEIGLGDGYFSSLLFRDGKKLTYGADLIFETIKSSFKYGYCENHIIMDASEIPLPDNSVGTVIMNNLIHHVPDREAVLREVMRVLKKGGRFIFTENTIGWGLFTWEQMLLRKLGLKALAQAVFNYKLRLFAQKLLLDDSYYDSRAGAGGFSIIKKINFTSKTSMYLSSLFEFLNLKQGQPTREETKRWTRLFGFKDRLDGCMDDIIRYCCEHDSELCKKEGYAYQFIVLEKTNGCDPGAQANVQYACPRCKKELNGSSGSYECAGCSIKYPVVDGIPIFLSYRGEIKGFDSYIEKKRKEEAKEYIT